jgi:DNA-binding transcriptional ArsR family regulator
MSYKAMDWAFSQELDDPQMKFVLIALCKHCDDKGVCYPSALRLSNLTGLSQRTVQRKLKKLEQIELIKVKRQFGKGHKSSNIYHVTVSRDYDTVSRNVRQSDTIISQEYVNNISSLIRQPDVVKKDEIDLKDLGKKALEKWS